MSAKPPASVTLPEQIVLALVLSAVAGFVDAFGWITLYHVYTANMTGNVVAFAVYGSHGGWVRIVERGVPVLFFALGVGVSEIVIETLRRYGQPRIIALAFTVELLLLAGLFALMFRNVPLPGNYQSTIAQGYIPGAFIVMAALAATAMGVQNASIRRVGALSVHTTHITGAVTSLMENFTALLMWLYDRMAGHSPRRRAAALRIAPRRENFRNTAILSGMLAIYIGGAFGGAIGHHELHFWALLFPIAALALLVGYEFGRPTKILRIGLGARTPRGSRTP